MPYALVETVDAIGNKELIAAPETWIERDESCSRATLFWPNVRNVTTLNAMLADTESTPMDGWEKHPCVVKCANVQTLAMAGKMIETLQKHWKDRGGPLKKVAAKEKERVGQEKERTGGMQSANKTQEEPDEVQLLELFTDLIRQVERSHDVVKKQLADGFYRMEKSLNELDAEQLPEFNGEQCVETLGRKPHRWNPLEFEFHVNPLTCLEDMDDFEERLNDEEYRAQIHRWIDYYMGRERNPAKRMVEILDALIDFDFLTKFSWSGRSATARYAFMNYTNVLELFKYAGTTPMHLATQRYVKQFFIRKLSHLSAAKPSNRHSMESPPTTAESDASCTVEDGESTVEAGNATKDEDTSTEEPATPSLTVNDDESDGGTPTPSVVEELDDVKNTCSPESPSTAKPATIHPPATTNPAASYPPERPLPKTSNLACAEIYMDRFRTIEELTTFEKQLYDPEIRSRVYRWTRETIGYEVKPELRMAEMLGLLFDPQFLPKFTWRGRRKDSYAMINYSNILRLFQYVATTPTHLASPNYVANFFLKTFRRNNTRLAMAKGLRSSAPYEKQTTANRN